MQNTSKRVRNKTTGRVYGLGSPDSNYDLKRKDKTAARNRARRLMIKKKLVKVGDDNHVDHRDNNPKNNNINNLRVQKASKNTSYARTSSGAVKKKTRKKTRKKA